MRLLRIRNATVIKTKGGREERKGQEEREEVKGEGYGRRKEEGTG